MFKTIALMLTGIVALLYSTRHSNTITLLNISVIECYSFPWSSNFLSSLLVFVIYNTYFWM